MALKLPCPLCKLSSPQTVKKDHETRIFECERCGAFEITEELFEDLSSLVRNAERRAFLSCATRQSNEVGRRQTLTTKNVNALIEEHQHSSIENNFEKLLHYIARCTKRPGLSVPMTDKDWPVIDVASWNELEWYLNNAVASDWILRAGFHCSLKAQGWKNVLGPAGGTFVPGRCFVAMSFSPSLEFVYRDGIAPAVREAGYDAVWMKDVLINGDICDRMLSEIRKAQLVVADFTETKAGVYFEAGFARALGREVFWTVQHDFKDQIHFDTNHYQHIVWKEPADLRQQLYEKIMAIVGPAPPR